MRKLKKTLLLIVTALLLTSCQSNKSYSNERTVLNIPVEPNQLISVNIPAELKLTQTDTMFYWEYDNGLKIKLIDSKNELTQSLSTFSVEIGDYALSVTDPYESEELKEDFEKYFYEKRDIVLPEDKEIKKLPKYSNVKMVMTDAGLYMPEDYTAPNVLAIQADYSNQKGSWILSCVRDRYYDDLWVMLTNIATRNCQVDEWYWDGSIFYCKTADTAVVAKALTINSFCVYICTPDSMLNYALKGAHDVHI